MWRGVYIVCSYIFRCVPLFLSHTLPLSSKNLSLLRSTQKTFSDNTSTIHQRSLLFCVLCLLFVVRFRFVRWLCLCAFTASTALYLYCGLPVAFALLAALLSCLLRCCNCPGYVLSFLICHLFFLFFFSPLILPFPSLSFSRYLLSSSTLLTFFLMFDIKVNSMCTVGWWISDVLWATAMQCGVVILLRICSRAQAPQIWWPQQLDLRISIHHHLCDLPGCKTDRKKTKEKSGNPEPLASEVKT